MTDLKIACQSYRHSAWSDGADSGLEYSGGGWTLSSCLQTLIFEWKSALNFNPWAKFQTFRQLIPPPVLLGQFQHCNDVMLDYCSRSTLRCPMSSRILSSHRDSGVFNCNIQRFAISAMSTDWRKVIIVNENLHIGNPFFTRPRSFTYSRYDKSILSVCPSHAGIVSKRLNISSKFCHRWIAQSLHLSRN